MADSWRIHAGELTHTVRKAHKVVCIGRSHPSDVPETKSQAMMFDCLSVLPAHPPSQTAQSSCCPAVAGGRIQLRLEKPRTGAAERQGIKEKEGDAPRSGPAIPVCLIDSQQFNSTACQRSFGPNPTQKKQEEKEADV